MGSPDRYTIASKSLLLSRYFWRPALPFPRYYRIILQFSQSNYRSYRRIDDTFTIALLMLLGQWLFRTDAQSTKQLEISITATVIGLHRMHCIDAAYCYRFRTQRGLCVCLSICWSHGCACKNGWTDQDAAWGADSDGLSKHMGVEISPQKRAILGCCPAHWKSLPCY